MIVFHGSSIEVATPDVCHSRPRVDFGPGFYVTTLYEQARKWSLRFKDAGDAAVISRYCCDEKAYAAHQVLTFTEYSEDWLDFVLRCRRGDDETPYEIIAGGVANDRVFNTVELFFEGLIDKGEAIRRLRFEKPNWQICFRTQKAIDECLTFEGSDTL